MAVDTLATFRAGQRVMANVTGIKVVHGVTPPSTGDASHTLLRPATDLLADAPAIVVGSGPASWTLGPVPRVDWQLNCAVWRSRDAFGPEAAYDGLVGDMGAIQVAVLARGKAYAVDAGLQSLTVTEFEAIDGIEWPAKSNTWWLVLPFVAHIVADYSTPITAA